MASDLASTVAPLRVLLVCTGNVCRSPLAEQLMRSEATRLGLSEAFVFESAGVAAEVGRDVHSQTQASMARFGHFAQPHQARQLTKDMLAHADLVLTATAEHRAFVAHQNVKANRYTFTCKEFLRVANFIKSDHSNLSESDQLALSALGSASDFVSVAAKFRGYAPRPESNEDIVDPWGLSDATFDAVTQEIDLIAKETIALLGAK